MKSDIITELNKGSRSRDGSGNLENNYNYKEFDYNIINR